MIFGMIIAAIVFEGILQVTDSVDYNRYSYDSSTGLQTYRPSMTMFHLAPCYQNYVKINSLGFHGPEVPTTKGSNVFRIVMIGSSFVEGLQVDTDLMFPVILENNLNADPQRKYTYQVIPFGFSRSATFLNTLYYKRYASSLNPDLVIDFATEYDYTHEPGNVQFNSKGDDILKLPPSPSLASKKIYYQSKLFMNILNRSSLALSTLKVYLSHPVFFIGHPDLENPEKDISQDKDLWNKEEIYMKTLNEQVMADKSKLLFVSWITNQSATSSKVIIDNNFKRVLSDLKVPYVNINDSITSQEKLSGTSAVWSCDDHFGPSGHRFAANAIYDYLIKNPELITKHR